MTLVLFGLGMSFLFAVGGAAIDARGIFQRKSSLGCIVATLIAGACLIAFVQLPSVQNAKLSKQTVQVQMQTQAPVVVAAQAALPAQPVKIIDAYGASSPEEARLDDQIDYEAQIQSHLLNNSFVEALDAYLALTSESDVSHRMQERWETQALRQIKPIPADNLDANRNGYLFLAAIRPDEPEYSAKVERYTR